MHSYLRAIGFSKLKNTSEQHKLISVIINDMTSRQEIEIGSGIKLTQIQKSFGNGIGLNIIGEQDEDGRFTLDHFFPYCNGSHFSNQMELQIDSHTDKEAFSIVSEDYSLGITLIYNLNNIIDYVKATWLNNYFKTPKKVKLGALSTEGKILYGVHLDYIACPYDKQPFSSKDRRNLIAKAKNGDTEAIENLTLDDMDTYSLITKRIKDEDLLTVVETYFMPYGIDNEHYAILGIIKNIEEITNEFSGEMVYNLSILCNDVFLNVVINAFDLQGEPKIGRRFKGIIWLQGLVDFAL